jgi:hypothetical protein
MLRIVIDATKLSNYQKQFEEELQRNGTKISCCISTPYGRTPEHGWICVSWLASVGIWFYSEVAIQENRWWNVFGIGEPLSYRSNYPHCEIYVPNSGINRHVAGGFAEEGNDVFLIHRGNNYGGSKRKGMTKQHFFSQYGGPKPDMDDGEQTNPVAVIAKLGDPQLASNIAGFVKWIHNLKE